MAENVFSNNHKVKMIAGAVYDQVPYLKKATSYMTQGELDGKKYGNTYDVYIPDPGKAVEGIEADPDTITEVKIPVTLDNINTSIETDVWNNLTDIEDFKREIVRPRATMLARSLEKKAIDGTVFKACQASVGAANFATLAEAAGKLDEVGVAGTKVSFIKPTVGAKIAAGGLANFIPDDIQKKIYAEKYLGQYAGAAQVEESLMPIVDATDITAAAASVTLTEAGAGAGFAPITSVSVTGPKAGWAFSADGLKIVDKNGIQTDQDYIIVIDKDGKIPELRITVDGKGYGNPNAWVAEGTTALTLAPILTEGKKYLVGQVRTQDALGFDTYKFADLPGSENATESVDGLSIKMSQYGDGKKMEVLTRLDIPHAVTLPDARNASLMYFEQA